MKRSLVAAVVAAFLAILGCASVYLYVQGADKRAVNGKEAVEVLIATKTIPVGTTGARIRDGGYTEKVFMPRSSLPPDPEPLQKIDTDLDEKVVTFDVHAKQLLLKSMFDEQSKVGTGLALPKGKMAVSIPIIARCANNVKSGFTVAVFNTFSAAGFNGHYPNGEGLKFEKDEVHVTRLVLPRVEVIAVAASGSEDQQSSGGQGQDATDTKNSCSKSDGGGVGNQTVLITVAVNQPDAEKLINALVTGTVTLAVVDESTQIGPGDGVDNKSQFAPGSPSPTPAQ